MSYPFLFLTITLIFGILIGSYFSLPISYLISGLVFFFLLSWLFYFSKKYKICFYSILVSLIIFGASLQILDTEKFEQNSLHQLKFTQYADFYGILYKSPQKGPVNDYLYLRVKKVIYQNKEQNVTGNLRISVRKSEISDTELNLFAGDEVKVSAKLLPLSGYRNFNRPSLKKFLKIRKIHHRAYTKSPLLIEKIKSGSKFSIFHQLSVLRSLLQKKIEKCFQIPGVKILSQEGAILEALLLGERRRIPDEVTYSLQKAGIYHLLAISGAHIAILSYLLFLIFKLMKVPRRVSYFLLILILISYTFLVESRPSVIRATIMAIAFLIGKLIWRDVNLVNTISFSAFFLLLVNPFYLFDVGFQLTFLAAFSIILFAPKIIKFLPLLPFKISELFGISLAAQLGVLPIIAYYFNRITFSSILLNLIAVPLVGLIMAFGFVFFSISFISFPVAFLFSQGLEVLINLLIIISHLADKISFLSYRIPTPFLFIILGYYLFLSLFLLPQKIKKQRLFITACFLIFLIILTIYPFSSYCKNLKLTFIDVGQGESILVEFPGKKKMLVDGGGTYDDRYDIGEKVVSPFLWSKGIKKIDYLVLTHAHPDHINGLRAIAKNFKIGQIWESVSPLQDKYYQQFLQTLPRGKKLKKMSRGNKIKEGEILIEVLHPEETYPLPLFAHNDHSLVLRISYYQVSFLLTGDIGVKAEKEILENVDDIATNILKSPHHGSKTSSSDEFLKRVNPEIVVISVALHNRFKFPDEEVISRYLNQGIKIFRTDLDGAIEISSDGQRIFTRKASDN
ncbi:MAG: DNA internalization-related competence protein ComEC/Rec2 [Candidatus Aminicenantia bacterium]